MDKKNLARIIGMGSYLPGNILSNNDLEKMVDTSDEWIFTRSGMRERRIADKDEFPSTMGVKAAKKALESANMQPDQLDLIIVATITPDYNFPSTAALVQKELKANGVAALDIHAACSGFLYGLSIAKAYIASGAYQNILLIASEKLSSIVNYKDRSTCVLFGDGAAAGIISNKGTGLMIRDVCLGNDGEHGELLLLPAGGSRNPATEETVAQNLHYLTMSGSEVFKYAVRYMELTTRQCLEKSGLSADEIQWLVPHQANVRIIDALAKRINIPNEKVFKTIHKYGNTSASAVAIALDELLFKHSIREGDNILLTAFGSGLTYGSVLTTQI